MLVIYLAHGILESFVWRLVALELVLSWLISTDGDDLGSVEVICGALEVVDDTLLLSDHLFSSILNLEKLLFEVVKGGLLLVKSLIDSVEFVLDVSHLCHELPTVVHLRVDLVLETGSLLSG